MPICTHCGAPIDFQRTPSGKLMPVQARGVYAVADDSSRHLAFDAAGNCIRVSEATKDDPDVIIVRFPHWAFCPGAEEAKKAEPPKAEAPRRAAPEPQIDEQLSFLGGTHGKSSTRGQYWRL